ncbi:hypothetical protein ACE34T_004742, partial [Vibrio alginolyticus]
ATQKDGNANFVVRSTASKIKNRILVFLRKSSGPTMIVGFCFSEHSFFVPSLQDYSSRQNLAS